MVDTLYKDLSDHWTGACGVFRVNQWLVSSSGHQANSTQEIPSQYDSGRIQSCHTAGLPKGEDIQVLQVRRKCRHTDGAS